MKGAIKHCGNLVEIPKRGNKVYEFKPTQGNLLSKCQKLTFLDIGTKEELTKLLVHSRKIVSGDAKTDEIEANQENYEEYYGGDDTVFQIGSFFREQ